MSTWYSVRLSSLQNHEASRTLNADTTCTTTWRWKENCTIPLLFFLSTTLPDVSSSFSVISREVKRLSVCVRKYLAFPHFEVFLGRVSPSFISNIFSVVVACHRSQRQDDLIQPTNQARQGKARQSKAKQSKAKQSKAKQSKAKQRKEKKRKEKKSLPLFLHYLPRISRNFTFSYNG